MEKKEKKEEHQIKNRIELDDWQKKIIEAKGNILLCTGRQVGKTLTFAQKAAMRMISKPNSRIIVVSLTEDQAQLIIIMVLDYLERHYKKMIEKRSKRPTKNRIILTNKSQILARPVGNTGDAVRGFTGDVLIVDEASRMPKMMWTAARPTLLTTGGEIWMCSTPFGKQGYFYECFLNKHQNYKVFRISSEKVIRNRPIRYAWTKERKEAAIKSLEEAKEEMSELEYAQEYLGEFIDDLRRYFDDELIDKVCIGKPKEMIDKGKSYYLGVDIARLGGDETALSIIERKNADHLNHVYTETGTNWLTTKTEERIYQLNDQYNRIMKIYLDAGAGSLGVGILDHLLKNERTKRKVEAVNNRKIVLDREGKSKQRLLKEDLYDNLRSLMQKSKIILLDDEKVRLSLRSVQYEYIQGVDKQSRLRIFGNYTHIVESLIRAAVCVKEKNINMLISSFPI